MLLETPIDGFTLRAATLADVGAILGFITELAVYEKLEHEVVATEAILTETLFGVPLNFMDDKRNAISLFVAEARLQKKQA